MARRDDVADLDEFGRFAEPALLILVSLADGAKHGYAITEDIASFAGVRFGPGSLYGAISRLESHGLIEALESEDRRNPYQLTTVGEKALRARLASMQAVAKLGQKRLATA
jgi:DNA-binding PadR family transcriptional regulator